MRANHAAAQAIDGSVCEALVDASGRQPFPIHAEIRGVTS
jgi:hypothetical protein